MNRYLITLGRAHYTSPEYPALDIGPEQTALADAFIKHFAYSHLTELSTSNFSVPEGAALKNWFLEKDPQGNFCRTADDLVVIHYTGHADLANDKDLRLVSEHSTPGDLLDTGHDPTDLLAGWISSPVRHVWLILDVCHSGGVADGLSEVLRHLDASIPANDKKGRGLHVVAACRERQSALVGAFAGACTKAFDGITRPDFGKHGLLQLDSLLHDLNQHMPGKQACQRHGGGETWPAFLPEEDWTKSQTRAGAAHPTDPDIHAAELAPLVQLLDSFGWPASWFLRFLPSNRRQQASRVRFDSVNQLVRWVCGLNVDDASRVCPLLCLAFGIVDKFGISEPEWLIQIATWRGADMGKSRDAAADISQHQANHEAAYPSRIKAIGAPFMDAGGSGSYSPRVNFQFWHDYEDSDGEMVLLLGDSENVVPTDPSLRLELEVYGQNCCVTHQPIFQFTLPLHLLAEPVDAIPVQDGPSQRPLGAVYQVILTAWERDHDPGFHASRVRRESAQRLLWTGEPAASATRVDITCTPLPEAPNALIGFAAAATGTDVTRAVNAGLPVILWSRSGPLPSCADRPWHDWRGQLTAARGHPGADAAVIWDDKFSGIRHLARHTPLRVPPRRPRPAA